MADLGAVTQAATAIFAALWQRERTGEGQFIAVSGEFFCGSAIRQGHRTRRPKGPERTLIAGLLSAVSKGRSPGDRLREGNG